LSTEENKLFIKCLQEFLNPVENPRYLLIKYDKFLSTIKQEDYFSIPAILSANKSAISTFKSLWNKYVGECEIIYTRNTQGRMKLLMARKNAFSSMQREKTKRLSKWQ
jgi:membrane-bound lytic murein transglycosylase MltF